MEKTLPLEERSIYQVYLESQETKTYVIPVYQRNYAWEENEITDLIKDVYDSFHKNPQAPYYIGTLVTFKRGDSKYEVIDGQQRLTTIYIILKTIGIQQIRNELTYSARKISAATLKHQDNYPELGEEEDLGIRNGYKYAEKAINNLVNESERQAFEQFFLHKVHLIHYNVPKDVDLNHYFEVMNSRGEQLEKHEIVKSTLSQYLKDKTEMATFSRVWEACSEMNVYIQQVFEDKRIFGNTLDTFIIESFEDIPSQNESEGKETIKTLLKQPISKTIDASGVEQNDKFQPIIDFSNFLLIVLKVTMMDFEDFNPLEFTLDDKELNRNIAGLIANKIANKYQRPCCILSKTLEIDPGHTTMLQDGTEVFVTSASRILYQGSARGYEITGVTNFKTICEAAGAEWCQGHENAFGMCLAEDQIERFLTETDAALADISAEPIYYVDYIYNNIDVNSNDILTIANLKSL